MITMCVLIAEEACDRFGLPFQFFFLFLFLFSQFHPRHSLCDYSSACGAMGIHIYLTCPFSVFSRLIFFALHF